MSLAACGGDGEKTTPTTGNVATGPSTSTLANGDEPPVSSPATASPTQTIRQLFAWLQSGALPSAASLYDKKVGQALTRVVFISALRQQAGVIKQLPTRIVGVERSDVGTLVLVRRTAQKGRPAQTGSYLMEKDGKVWRIKHDSLLADSIVSVVMLRTQARSNPKAKQPGPAAIAAGRAAGERYDSLFGPSVATP